ncbi:MAG: MotA/TolQ/ExbB proton channel family protein [Bdellovibrionota bacterium]
MDSLIKFFQDGGWHMIPNVILFLVGSAIMVERMYKIMFVYQADGASLMHRVQRMILDNNIDEAIKLCNSRKDASIYQVFKAALVNADRPFDEIQDHVEAATLAVVPKLQRRMPYLFTIANVATLLGLLGTIAGLITTFEAVGAVEGAQKQLLLSAGISTAMNNTAFGLFIAIPCMLIYGFLTNRISGIVDEVEHYSARLLILLRTGSQYFENFSSDSVVTTQQTPKKKNGSESAEKDGKQDAA